MSDVQETMIPATTIPHGAGWSQRIRFAGSQEAAATISPLRASTLRRIPRRLKAPLWKVALKGLSLYGSHRGREALAAGVSDHHAGRRFAEGGIRGKGLQLDVPVTWETVTDPIGYVIRTLGK